METTLVPIEVAILEVIVIDERRAPMPARAPVEIDEDVLLGSAGWLDSHTCDQLIAVRTER